MSNLYITADVVNQPNHGGGSVTGNEAAALKELGPTEVLDRNVLSSVKAVAIEAPSREALERELQSPWCWDHFASQKLTTTLWLSPFRLAHLYAGTFSSTVKGLKENGVRISYTAAAHDISVSRREHESLGIPFNYPHLTDPELWRRYVAGYLAADVVVCPSQHSASCMRSFGAKNIEVIPHGVSLPDLSNSTPPSAPFTVGYLGSYGPDKGVRYLLSAWKQLAYKDAILVLAGRDSTSDWVNHLIREFGGGNIVQRGWVDSIEQFYGSIHVYCQPSASEGFALEVLEAMAHGRTVICSTGAGACDVVPKGWWFESCNVEHLISQIEDAKRLHRQGNLPYPEDQRDIAKQYTWDTIKLRYQQVWKELMK